MSDLYDEDILLWSVRQASLLDSGQWSVVSGQ